MGAIPTYVNQGDFTAGTGAISVPVPTGYADGDILVLLVSSANETIATPGGWTEVANSPQGAGTAGAAGGVRLAVFWKLVSGAQSAASVADSGNLNTGQMFLFRGIDTSAPINITAGSVNTPASTDWACPAVTTTTPNCLILLCIALDYDGNSTTETSGWANAGLTSITERADRTVNSATGGGLALATAGRAATGDIGTTSVTSAHSTTAAFITVALAPPTTFGVSQAESSAVSDIIGGGGGAPIEAARTETAAPSETTVGIIPDTASQAETAAATEEYLPYKKVTVVGVVNLPIVFNDVGEARTIGSAAITVPDGVDFCILFVGSRQTYVNSVPPYYDAFLYSPWPGHIPNSYSLSGQTMAFAARSQELDELAGNNRYVYDVASYILAAPPLGEQEFEWDFNPISDAHFFSLIFYANVHQTDPLVITYDYKYFRAGATASATPVSRTLTAIASEEGGLTVGAMYSWVSDLSAKPTIETGSQFLRLLQGSVDTLYDAAMMVGDFPGGTSSSFVFTNVSYAGYLAFSLRRSEGELYRAAQAESIGSVSDASLGQDQTQYVHSAITETLAVSEAGSSDNAESADQEETAALTAAFDGEALPSGAEIAETAQVADAEDATASNDSFDRGVGEGAACSTESAAALSAERAAADTFPVRQINGPYVDIPTEMMFSDSRSYQINDYANTAIGSRGVTIHANTNLLIFTYHTLFYTPAWIQEGNYTLTLNGVPFTHLANTNAEGYNVMVAYFKNPESGTVAWNFPNPNFGGVEEYADIIKICQFTNVDVSGDPFRSIVSPEGVTNSASLTLSGISFNEGDMVVGIEYGMGGGAYGEVRCDVGKQPSIVSGGAYNTSYGWSIRTTVGAEPWGSSSITATAADGATQDYIYMMALVLKVKLEGWIASPAAVEAGSLILSDTLTGESTASEAAERTDSAAVSEALVGDASHTEEGAEAESAAIAEAQVGTQTYGMSEAESSAITESQAAARTANGMGYAWAISRATQNGWKVADCLWSDDLAVEEVVAAGQGTPAGMTDELTVADVVTAYAEAGALMAELMVIAEDSSVTQVLGGAISETMQVTAQAVTTAEMYAAVVEAVILIDQWLAEALRREIKKFMAGGRVTSFLHRLVDLSQFMVDKKMLEFDCVPAAREILEQERFTDYAPDQPRSEAFTAEKASVSFQCPKNVQFTAELVPVIFYCAEVKAAGETPTKKDFEV